METTNTFIKRLLQQKHECHILVKYSKTIKITVTLNLKHEYKLSDKTRAEHAVALHFHDRKKVVHRL